MLRLQKRASKLLRSTEASFGAYNIFRCLSPCPVQCKRANGENENPGGTGEAASGAEPHPKKSGSSTASTSQMAARSHMGDKHSAARGRGRLGPGARRPAPSGRRVPAPTTRSQSTPPTTERDVVSSCPRIAGLALRPRVRRATARRHVRALAVARPPVASRALVARTMKSRSGNIHRTSAKGVGRAPCKRRAVLLVVGL